MTAERGGAFFPLPGTQVAGARPVGWLPDGRLVAIEGPTSKAGAPGTLLGRRPSAAALGALANLGGG